MAQSMTFAKAVSLTAEQITEKNWQAVLEALRGEKITKEEAAIRFTRRELAVKKDVQRKKDGKHAARFYRGDEKALPKDLRAKAAAVLERVDGIREEQAPAKIAKKAPRKQGGAAVSL